jgi:transposase
MRRTPEDMAAARREIAKRYTRGKRVVRGRDEDGELSAADREWRMTKACFLKANDASASYIAQACNVSRGTIRAWLAQPSSEKKVAELRKDMLAGAQRYLRSYAIELIELLVQIAKDPMVDAATRLRAICEALDRMGVGKVAKSESTQKSELDIADPTGLIAQLKASPEQAVQAAIKIEELQAIVSEGVVR